jgi:hypothetical protein
MTLPRLSKSHWQLGFLAAMGLFTTWATIKLSPTPLPVEEAAIQEIVRRGFSLECYDPDGIYACRTGSGNWCGTGMYRTVNANGSVPFEDRDLVLFDHLGKLNTVELTGTNVTDDGVAAFKYRHPNCRIR